MIMISVIYNRRQGGGYEITASSGKKIIARNKSLGEDPWNAAAYAVQYQAKFGGNESRIIAPENVMSIINNGSVDNKNKIGSYEK